MNQKHSARLRAALCLLTLLVAVASAAAQNPSAPRIRTEDRVRVAEAFRLCEKLCDRVWKNWSKAPFAVLLVTPEHEFLIRHPAPSNDFKAAGYEPLLKSQVYYRARTVQPNLLATYPAVGGISTVVIGQPENTAAKTSTRWVVTLLHEHFHQLQDSQPNFYTEVNALNLARGDQTGMWMLNFPFPYDRAEVLEQFSALARSLRRALSAAMTKDFRARVADYTALRKRFQETLAADDYKYFSFQLWKEGVARYTEYRIAELAARRYKPTKEFAALADYTTFDADARQVRERIMNDLEKMSLDKRQRTAFYPFGAAEAMLLDAASEKWQKRYLAEKFFLDRYFTP